MLVFRAHPLTIPDCLEYFCPPDHTYAALWRVNKQTLKKTRPLPHFLCVTHMAVHGCLKDKTTRTKSPMHPTSMSLACHRCDTTVAIDTTNFAYSACKCAQSLPSSFLPCREIQKRSRSKTKAVGTCTTPSGVISRLQPHEQNEEPQTDFYSASVCFLGPEMRFSFRMVHVRG